MAVVAPLSGHTMLIFLLQVGVLLGVALLLGRLAVRLGMPAIVGELLAGVLLGPSLLQRFAPTVGGWLLPQEPAQLQLLDAVGQLGVLLLVAVTGMHLDLQLVRRRAATVAKVSGAALLVPLGFGIAAGFVLPDRLRTGDSPVLVFALFLGVAMCVSAIPVIAKTLIDLKLIHRDLGQLILVTGSIDDAFGWLMLSVVSALATTGLTSGGVVRSIAAVVAVLVLTATVGRWVVQSVLRLALRSGEQTVPIAAAAVLVVLSAAATHALKLEPVFGAFLCGILLATCRQPHTATPTTAPSPTTPARTTPASAIAVADAASPIAASAAADWVGALKVVVLGVLAPLFFATAGLRVDLVALGQVEVALSAVAVVALAIAGKFLGAGIGAALSGMNRWEALALGAGLNSRGVVEIVIASVGVTIGILSTEMYTIILLVAVVTSLMAPPILRLAMARVESTAEEAHRELTQPGASPQNRPAPDPLPERIA